MATTKTNTKNSVQQSKAAAKGAAQAWVKGGKPNPALAAAQAAQAALVAASTTPASVSVPGGLLAGMLASMAGQGAAPATKQATARTRTPSHAAGIMAHVCTVGRRAGKQWYATGSTGYLIGALLCQHQGAGRKAAIAAAVGAGYSAGSVTSCWGDFVAYNASLAQVGLGTLAQAYAMPVPVAQQAAQASA